MSDERKLDKWTALIIAIIIIAGSYMYVEGKKLDYQKAKDEQKQEKIEENKDAREECLSEASDDYDSRWTDECKMLHLKKDCALPSYNANRQEKLYEQARNECIKMYPAN